MTTIIPIGEYLAVTGLPDISTILFNVGFNEAANRPFLMWRDERDDSIFLPEGNWAIKGTLDDLTQDQFLDVFPTYLIDVGKKQISHEQYAKQKGIPMSALILKKKTV
jgi:hypothetical protein